jgi:xyloglucan 6-xylosyltransferase
MNLAGRPDFEADDQWVLIYLLITQSELWSNELFLESSFYLHGYWVIIVDTYEEKYHPGLGVNVGPLLPISWVASLVTVTMATP